MRNIFLSAITLMFLNACTEGLHEAIVPVSLVLNNINPITIIDAKIEKDNVAWVQISYSNDLDNPFTSLPIFESNATITIISSNGMQEKLNYSGKNGIYQGKSLVGNIGDTYSISININGQNYSANATMLPTAIFNSVEINTFSIVKNGIAYPGYDEVWYIKNDPKARNLYLFEWWTNGVHNSQQDWAIDDDRIPNGSNGIRVFNPTITPNANERIEFKMAEIDLNIYNYYNMYEKIVRGMVSVASQTPYNPYSSFGMGTIGNFRAVSFATHVALIPPDLGLKSSKSQVSISFPTNKLFVKYNLYWSNTAKVNTASNKISNLILNFTSEKNPSAIYNHVGLNAGTYYYRIESEDAQGNKSLLSPEVSVIVP